MEFKKLIEIIGSNTDDLKSNIAKQAALFAVASSDENLLKNKSGRKLVKAIFNIDLAEPKPYATLSLAEEAYESIMFDLIKERDILKSLKKYSSESFEDLLDNFSSDKNLVKFVKKLHNTFDFTTLNVTKKADNMLIAFKDTNSEMAEASAFVKENVCEHKTSFIEKDYEFKDFLLQLTLDIIKKSTRTAYKFSNVGEIAIYGFISYIYIFATILANLRDIYSITDKPISEMQIMYSHNVTTKIFKATILETMALVKSVNSTENLRDFAEFNLCRLVENVTIGQFKKEDENPLKELLEELTDETETIDLDNGKSVTIGKIEIDMQDKEKLKQKLQNIIDNL